LPVAVVGVVAELCGHPGSDADRLGHPDGLSDDRPGGGLVRAVELYWPQAGVACLEVAYDRVAFGDGREVGAVDVERQDAFDVAANLPRWQCAGVGNDVGQQARRVLRDAYRDGRPGAVGGEGEVEAGIAAPWPAGKGFVKRAAAASAKGPRARIRKLLVAALTACRGS
jgi:hypothetical protein